MSKDELVFREDVEQMICVGLNSGTWGYDACCILAELREIPAAPQPMSAVEYFRHKQRMCAFNGAFGLHHECGLGDTVSGSKVPCSVWAEFHPEEAVAIVQKWAEEHPEEVNDAIS